MGNIVNELHAMLKLHEQTLAKKDVAPAFHAIRPGKVQKNQKKKPHKAAKGNQGKRKAKMGYAPVHAPSFAPKPKNPPTPKKENHAKDTICHQCGKGLKGSRKLKPGALSLYVGDGHRTTVEAIREYLLCLPSGLALILHNCHYTPYITRGIISVSHLDDIYEIDLSSSNTNDSFMYAISNKRAKLNLDSTLLWHCRLGHISKKRIEKLQHDGLLNSTDIKAKDLLRLIHTDVCGPFKTMSRKGASYFVTFTDDFSPYGYVYLLKHKHQVFETFKVFQKEVENQLGNTIKSLRSDREGEYMSLEFLDHLKEHRIIAYHTPPYTPQHNGVSERRNRTLLDMVRSMMSQTTLPKSFWDYALESAARILNMVLTKKVDKTPYEVCHGQAPKLSYLKVWGCEALFKRDTLTKSDKLEPRSIKSSGSLEDLEIIQEEDTHPSIDTSLDHEKDDQEIDEPQSDTNPICKSTRTRRAPDRMCLHVNAEEHELGDLDNEVWELVDLPPNGKTIGNKWLFKKKTDMDSAVHTFKACLIANCFTQTYEVDYEETFSPVADIRAIRILIAIAAFYDYEIWQMDAKNAFLNGHLSEEVYMVQPEGFVNPKYPNQKFGFSQNRDEPCVYMKASGSYVTFLILYVDDILIMGNNIPMLQDVKYYLGRCFAMKDLGEAAYILRIKIYRDRPKRLIGLCQSAYTEKILKRYFMENSKRGTIPM
ncbi:retrotransposon protein, putative, ty1-copia subclass [Tanacetum coccineum]|uniref:Retrotransposon protein, putative, ty1-copia subclass n=1 Tax=Tanacetum coccineum TaxID=301880 RepID=A0ABQ5D6H8_9ASTR